MDTTIIVQPRERYSQMIVSMESLFSTIPRDVRVIAFDAGAPEHIRQEMRRLEAERPYERIESEEMILPPQVRNRGLAMVETKYVCYCDNDIDYRPGWLEALEETAEHTGAAAVAPLTILGPLERPEIHHAGSEIRVTKDSKGRPIIDSHHRLDHTLLDVAEESGALAQIPRASDEFEYHCALLRTDVAREMGGHDETQVKFDCLEDSLRIKMLGYDIAFAPEAVVCYRVYAPFKSYDWDYFFYRWSDDANPVWEKTIGDHWGVRKNYEENEANFLHNHQRRVIGTTLPSWTQKLPFRVRNRLNGLVLNYLIAPRVKRKEFDVGKLQTAPQPPSNALELAGIPGAEILRNP